jgi:hypothetical protein
MDNGFPEPTIDFDARGGEDKDTPSFLRTVFGDVLNKALPAECASNAIKMVCNSLYKECVEAENVVTGELEWVPALMCRDGPGSCQHHKNIWDACMRNLEEDLEAKAYFEDQMELHSSLFSEKSKDLEGVDFPTPQSGFANFRLLECGIEAEGDFRWDSDAWYVQPGDRIVDQMLGRTEGTKSWDFPAGMAPQSMYPVEFSQYTNENGDYNVPCTRHTKTNVEARVCPLPYVAPTRPDTQKTCVRPCPAQTFTNDEWSLMMNVSNAVAVVGGLLNFFMALTWVAAGGSYFEQVPMQLKNVVFGGLLYFLIDTLPSMLWGFQLPCGSCGTEECVGEKWICVLNRSGEFILVFVIFNLALLTRDLNNSIKTGSGISKSTRWNVVSFLFPLTLLSLGYGFDMDDNLHTVPNAALNVARHAFKCRWVNYPY